METVFAAVVSAVAAIVVCVINSNNQHKKALAENEAHFNKMLAEIDKHNALQSQEIKQLTKQVEKHNKVIERVYKLEKAEAVIEEEIKVANHRIEDLEHFHK
jgi:septal ring factor EnvC (AmiA/AmiB activator)